MEEPKALWNPKNLPKVWDPIEELRKVKYSAKDIEKIRKYVIDGLDKQMEGSKKDEDCFRSSDINRVMRVYDRLLLFNCLEGASEKGRDTYGKAEDESKESNDITGSLVVGDPNSYVVVYRLPIGKLKTKNGGPLKVFVSIIEHQICHLLIFYYRPKDVKNGEQHTKLHSELMLKIFGHKTQSAYLNLDFSLEKTSKPVGELSGIVVAPIHKQNSKQPKIYQKSPENVVIKTTKIPGGKTSPKKKPSPSRSPIQTVSKPKKAAAKKKSAAKKKPSPPSSPVSKPKTSPKKKKPAAKKTSKVKSPVNSNTPKKTKGKKFPKGLTLGPFRKEAASRGYDKEETKVLWQRYKKGEI